MYKSACIYIYTHANLYTGLLRLTKTIMRLHTKESFAGGVQNYRTSKNFSVPSNLLAKDNFKSQFEFDF